METWKDWERGYTSRQTCILHGFLFTVYDNVVHYLAGATVTQTPASKPPSEGPVSTNDDMNNGVLIGAVCGAVCAVVAFLVLVVSVVICCYFKRRKTNKAEVHTCTGIFCHDNSGNSTECLHVLIACYQLTSFLFVTMITEGEVCTIWLFCILSNIITDIKC